MTQSDTSGERISDAVLDLLNDLRDAAFRPGENPRETAEKLAEVPFHVDSADRTVRVHMNAAGLLEHVEFRNRAFTRHDERSLGQVVQSTISKAEATAKDAVRFAADRRG